MGHRPGRRRRSSRAHRHAGAYGYPAAHTHIRANRKTGLLPAVRRQGRPRSMHGDQLPLMEIYIAEEVIVFLAGFILGALLATTVILLLA